MIRLCSLAAPLAILGLLLVSACTTTYMREGVELPPDQVAAIEAQANAESVDYQANQIRAIVDSVRFERGPKLLQSLQWLVSMGELAVPVVIAELDQSDARTRAHLLYVLGFTRTKESTGALVGSLSSPDQIVRFEAAAGLLNHGDTTSVPVLIDFLGSEDRAFRYKAIEALRGVLGQDFDYEFAAPAELRNVSISRWREWWSNEKTRLMYRPGAEVGSGN